MSGYAKQNPSIVRDLLTHHDDGLVEAALTFIERTMRPDHEVLSTFHDVVVLDQEQEKEIVAPVSDFTARIGLLRYYVYSTEVRACHASVLIDNSNKVWAIDDTGSVSVIDELIEHLDEFMHAKPHPKKRRQSSGSSIIQAFQTPARGPGLNQKIRMLANQD